MQVTPLLKKGDVLITFICRFSGLLQIWKFWLPNYFSFEGQINQINKIYRIAVKKLALESCESRLKGLIGWFDIYPKITLQYAWKRQKTVRTSNAQASLGWASSMYTVRKSATSLNSRTTLRYSPTLARKTGQVQLQKLITSGRFPLQKSNSW